MAATATLQPVGAEDRPQQGDVGGVSVVIVLSSGEEEELLREKNKGAGPQSWTKGVQSEPLNLTLGGGKNGEQGGQGEQEDDDVLFVTAYVEDEENVRPSAGSKPMGPRKRGPQKGGGGKGTPRRNPARRARRAKHFPDFEEVNFDEDDFPIDGEDDDDDDFTYISNNVSKQEDASEEWTVAERRAKQKKKLMAKKLPVSNSQPQQQQHQQQQQQQQQQQKTNKPGRKRRNVANTEKKVNIHDMEPLVRCNLHLLTGYMDLMASYPSSFSNDFRRHLIEITKRQNILLNLTRGVTL